MIWTGQENPLIIFKSIERYLWFKNKKQIPDKNAEIMKKKGVFGMFPSFLEAL